MHQLVKILILTCIVFWSNWIFAQDSIITDAVLNLKYESMIEPKDKLRSEIDSITYQLYLNKDYKALLKASSTASKEEIDFYYLNYRTAIANYELKKYAEAIKYYKKALVENPLDADLNAGLYNSYLLNGQRTEADILWKENFKKGITTLPIKLSLLDYAGVDFGYLISGNTQVPSYFQNQYRNMYYGNVNLGLNLNERWKLHVGTQIYNSDFRNYSYTVSNNNPRNDDNNTIISSVTSDLLSQYTFIFSTDYTLKNSWQIGFSGGFYQIEKTEKITGSSNFTPAYSGQIFVNKHFTYFIPEFSAAYSNFGGSNQYQTSLQLTYYPLGNTNLYNILTAGAVYNQDSVNLKQFIVSEKIGLKLVNNLWAEAMISTGNHASYISNRSFLTYDTYDPIKFISGCSLIYYFKHFDISLNYQLQQREAEIFKINNIVEKKTYNNHLLNLGILWYFQ